MGDLRMLFAEDKDKVMKMQVNHAYKPSNYLSLKKVILPIGMSKSQLLYVLQNVKMACMLCLLHTEPQRNQCPCCVLLGLVSCKCVFSNTSFMVPLLCHNHRYGNYELETMHYMNGTYIFFYLVLIQTAVIQVKKIVEGSFQPFQLMYRPLLQEYISDGILKTSTYGQQKAFKQVFISFYSRAPAQ
jgi:hypothetical protein